MLGMQSTAARAELWNNHDSHTIKVLVQCKEDKRVLLASISEEIPDPHRAVDPQMSAIFASLWVDELKRMIDGGKPPPVS